VARAAGAIFCVAATVPRQGRFRDHQTAIISLIKKENFRAYHPPKLLANEDGGVL
jgi:hypothetical protein